METDGLCECGCGQPTALSKLTRGARGLKKGDPVRFIKGHHKRPLTTDAYPSVGIGRRVVRVHRVRAERALGKPLPPGAEVHHVDGTKSTASALVICPDRAYHMLLHARTRVLRGGGDPNRDRFCADCKVLRLKSEFYGSGNQCRDCQSVRAAAYRRTHAAYLSAYERRRGSTPARIKYMRDLRLHRSAS